MAFRVYEEGGRRPGRSVAPSMQANTAWPARGERYTFCRPRPAPETPMHALRPFALLAAALALIAGAPAASAQTVLTMSSWVPPTHSLTRDVLVAWSKEVEKATNGRVKLEMLHKHPSAHRRTLAA